MPTPSTARQRAPQLPYPELVDPETAPRVIWWRMAWLRSVAQEDALHHAVLQRMGESGTPLFDAMVVGLVELRRQAARDFSQLAALGGLLYAWLPEGGAA